MEMKLETRTQFKKGRKGFGELINIFRVNTSLTLTD